MLYPVRHILLTLALLALGIAGAHQAAAAPAVVSGRPFGSRDTHACGKLSGSAPTQAQALSSFICHQEGLSGGGVYLHLIEGASLQLGAPRRYNFKEDYNVGNIDTTAQVYPIRGSFKEYTCSPPSDYMNNRGRNCSITNHPNATGLCYKDAFGDWMCSMGDPSFKIVDQAAAPPGGVAVAASPAPTPAARAPQLAPQGPNKAQQAAAPPRSGGLPKPDFSELEKYVDVISYSYGDNVSDHNLTMVVKPKTSAIPMLCMQFLDRAGGLVDASDSACGTGIHMGYSPEAGQVTKFDVPMPYANDTGRVVAARVFRPGR